jgi:hypothetical protein
MNQHRSTQLSRAVLRTLTLDKAPATVIFAAEQIGPSRTLTPEGFLLCANVPIARTGTMMYGPGEVPVQPGPTGVSYVTRDADSLFHDSTVASFNGKPVTFDHPPIDVNPKNWRQYAVGVCLNPRRGEGGDADVLLADLLITDARTVEAVLADKSSPYAKFEVSAGYEADYEQTGVGEGRQTSIIGNHVALVDRGRCGPRCAIGDHLPPNLNKEPSTMTTKLASPPSGKIQRRPLSVAVRRLFADAAEALASAGNPDLNGTTDDETLADGMPGGGGDTHIHIHAGADSGDAGGDMGAAPTDALPPDDGGGMSVEDRIAALEQGQAQIMEMLQSMTGGGDAAPADAAPADAGGDLPPDDGGLPPDDGMSDADLTKTKDRAMVGDSAALERSFADLVSDAEVLVPGFRLPTFDSRQPRKVTLDSMCAIRRRVLGHLVATADGAKLLNDVAGEDFSIEKSDCGATALVYRAAAGARRHANNSTSTRDASRLAHVAQAQGGLPVGGVVTLTDLNARNRAYWEAQRTNTKH